MSSSFGFTPAMTEEERMLQQKELWLNKMRGWLMVVAVLVASVAYQAGLNPPGGFWQDDMATYDTPGSSTTYIRGQGHFAGDPVLRDKNFNRYAVFMAFNTVAFVQSLCVIVVLMSESSFHGKLRLYMLRVFVVIHVTALGMAYLVGSFRDTYDLYFTGLVMFVCVAIFATVGLGMHYRHKAAKNKNKAREVVSTAADCDDEVLGM